MLHDAPITSNHRLQHCTPTIGTMDVARSQRTPLDIAELVEYEQRVIAGAGEMPVIRATFLFAIGRAFARIHVEYDGLRSSPLAHFVDPPTGQIGKGGNVLGSAQPLGLEAPHLAGRGRSPT